MIITRRHHLPHHENQRLGGRLKQITSIIGFPKFTQLYINLEFYIKHLSKRVYVEL